MLAQLREQLPPGVLHLLDRVVAERGLALRELVELLGRVVLLEHRHRLQGFQERCARLVAAIEGVEEPAQPGQQRA